MSLRRFALGVAIGLAALLAAELGLRLILGHPVFAWERMRRFKLPSPATARLLGDKPSRSFAVPTSIGALPVVSPAAVRHPSGGRLDLGHQFPENFWISKSSFIPSYSGRAVVKDSNTG